MAPLFRIAVLLNLSVFVVAQGTQFITGACTSDTDCASSCCGFNTGKCAAPIPAQERDGGCGFGNAQSNAGPNTGTGAAVGGSGNAAVASSAASSPSATSAAGAGSGKPPGTQFITGVCASDADCASACCGFKSGKCAAVIPAQERDGGCGFGDAQPNAGPAANNTGANGGGATVQAQSGGDQASAASSAIVSSSTGAATNAGTQFITGTCTSDADCASACCGFKSGKCAGPVVAQERDGGCGFGDAQPNDNAAKALQGRSLGKFGASFM